MQITGNLKPDYSTLATPNKTKINLYGTHEGQDEHHSAVEGLTLKGKLGPKGVIQFQEFLSEQHRCHNEAESVFPGYGFVIGHWPPVDFWEVEVKVGSACVHIKNVNVSLKKTEGAPVGSRCIAHPYVPSADTAFTRRDSPLQINRWGELAALDSDAVLHRPLHRYAVPDLMVIDQIGLLSSSNRHADLLFGVD